ncbi:MAG: TorF family putative porin [Pseudomonadales bacterium]
MKNLIAVLALLSAGYAAAAEVSGNVAYATDYRFRGISQTDRDMALQGGFDYDFGNGFYAGTWASNVQFGGSIEVDWYGGYAGEINEEVSFDVGYMWYNYPSDNSDPDLDYHEIYGSLSYMDGTVGLVYSNDYFQETDTFIYLYGEYSWAINEDFALDFHLGWNSFDDDAAFAEFIIPAVGEDPGDDYIDYSITLSTSAAGLDFGLAFIGTDIDDKECFGGDDRNGKTELCDDTIVLSVSKSL